MQTNHDFFVELENISHAYDQNPVLSHITYSFYKNKITAVLGKSGSGKSTLLQVINGMVRPDQGTVNVNNKPIDYQNIHSLRLNTGYVVQKVGLFPHMSIRKNISLPAKIGNKSSNRINERIAELMKMVDLPESYLPKFPHELSGGEQQRAGLCRALMLDPPLILMDEPFASLDYGTKRKIYNYILNIQKTQSRTIIIVTHDWDEAIILADYFLWVSEGKIKASGNKSDLEQLKIKYFSEL